MVAFLELDMLTTAFVATYVRLHTGGSGSGFARDALPEALRSAHDEIIDMRNKASPQGLCARQRFGRHNANIG
jgi:hypothetical protein